MLFFLFFSSEPVHLIPNDGKSEGIDVGNAKQGGEPWSIANPRKVHSSSILTISVY
jgi:hypothetical protein